MIDYDQNYAIEHKEWFCEITWVHFSNCIKAYENGELLSSAIFAAVFAESILKDILDVLDAKMVKRQDGGRDEKDEDREIYSLSRMKESLELIAQSNAKKYDYLDDLNRAYLKDIAGRSDEIRQKRNRLVHNTGVVNTDLQSDTDDIIKNVKQIIVEYLNSEISCRIYDRKTAVDGLSAREEPAATEDFPMFVSTITPHKFEQIEFITEFCNQLRSIGIRPVRCTLTEFDRNRPMEITRECIRECRGVIIIGLERSHSYFNRDKEGSLSEKEDTHRRYSSGWLQLEAGMAIGMEKPLFVLCQKDLFGDGIFDRDWNSYAPANLSLPLDIHDPIVGELMKRLQRFKDQTCDSIHT